MKRLALLAGVAGMALLLGLILHEGWSALLHALARAGWPMLWLLPLHLLPLLLDTLGWRSLLAASGNARHAPLPFLLWVAAVREAVARLLPSAGIGGEIVGIRLCGLRIADTAAVSASVIAEVLITMVGQSLFCGLGIALMAHVDADMRQLGPLAAGLALGLPLPALVYLLLRHGAVFARIERWAQRLLGDRGRHLRDLDGARLDAEIHRLFKAPRPLARTLAWQCAGYVAGTIETWLALRLLGHPVGLVAAIAIEALSQASRHATAMVPGGLGVQDAAIMLFGHLAGVGGETALALALIKRLREILFGVPVLLSWYAVEARRLRPSSSTARP